MLRTGGAGATADPDATPDPVTPSVNSRLISIRDAHGNEANEPGIHFHVILFPEASHTVRMDYRTAPGLATAHSDYRPVSGTLTFAPGQVHHTIAVEAFPGFFGVPGGLTKST